MTFYATLGVVDSDPTIYRVRYDSATKRLYEEQFLPFRSGSTLTYPSYPATPDVVARHRDQHPADDRGCADLQVLAVHHHRRAHARHGRHDAAQPRR